MKCEDCKFWEVSTCRIGKSADCKDYCLFFADKHAFSIDLKEYAREGSLGVQDDSGRG